MPDSTLELTWPAARLVFWWLFGGSLLLGATWRLRSGGSALGALALLTAGVYTLAMLAPSLAHEKILLERDDLSIHTGPWTRPYVIRLSLQEVRIVYEFANSRWTIADRYLILERIDHKRQRFRQTALFELHRDRILAELAARDIEIRRDRR